MTRNARDLDRDNAMDEFNLIGSYEEMQEKVIKIYEKGYEDGRKERDYDPHSHSETYDLQCKIKQVYEKAEMLK